MTTPKPKEVLELEEEWDDNHEIEQTIPTGDLCAKSDVPLGPTRVSDQEIISVKNPNVDVPIGWAHPGSSKVGDEIDCLPSYEVATAAATATTTPSAPPLNDTEEEISVPRKKPETIDQVTKFPNSHLKTISIGINLVRSTKRLLSLLRRVDQQQDLYIGQRVKAAIYRYERYWLPLISKNDKPNMLPPLDVHWVWVVHMLAPQHYEKDCLVIIGKVPQHRLMSNKCLERCREAGRSAWEKSYPNEPWKLIEDPNSSYDNKDSQISYDLTSAIGRQSAFFYQVSLEHYKSKPFLYKAIRRYRQFLILKRAHPDVFLVPCYDMDIVWHAHQVHPLVYKSDTERILGHVFPHDDSVNDRSHGSKLMVSDGTTRDMWLQSFGATFRREGSMFRGDPPISYLSEIPDAVLDSMRTSTFHVQITEIKVKGKFSNGHLKVKLKRENEKLCEFTIADFSNDSPNIDVAKMNIRFSVHETTLKSWVVLKLASKKFGKLRKILGKGTFWCMTNLTDLFSIDQEGSVNKVFYDEDSSSTVEIQLNVIRERGEQWVPIGILTGEFLPHILDPKELISLYGMVTETKSDNQDIYLAEMATHRMLNESCCSKPQLLEVEVVHSRHFMFSSIKIFADCPARTLVGLAHTLDLNTVPSPMELKYTVGAHLSETIATLNLGSGERAMLIKAKGRDWALLTARWDGLRRGVKGSFSARGVSGSPGCLVMKVFDGSGARPTTVKLPYDKQIYAFHLPNFFIDMENGLIQLKGNTIDVVEQVAFALSITVLHVLCQPRMMESLDQPDSGGGGDKNPSVPKRIPTERLKLLGAMGFFCAAAPTNTSLRNGPKSPSHYYAPALMAVPLITAGGIGACGSCGGCGGCGGGVFETLPHPPDTLWGGKEGNGEYDDGGGGNDWGSGGEGNDWGFSPGDSSGGGNFMEMFFGKGDSGGGDDGGGGGGGGEGGDGGGCGGCGGCGG